MLQSEIKKSVEELIQMVEEGKTLEAFEKFYHEDLVAQENQTEPRIGKEVGREFEANFVGNIEQIRTYKAVSTMIGSGVSAIAWEIDIDHKEWGTVQMTEINLQTWKDGKIIRETYNYTL
ncbi:SnoaL-like domain-containing protein [Aureivirga marina]|uniref:SnoaL-like domain-containing protein n=1 Tax=Aureivirga marina TaxID=1182451 RepID=UPI0018C94AF6|nr:SnoaL-like domain-containing protein [Aureivirga marina]